jgi:hypothetical protein
MIGVIAIVLMSLSYTQAPQFEAALTGRWTGTLEYRDYRSDKRVTLPTTLVVAQAGPGLLTFAYAYDDGPGKTVTSQDRITVDAERSTYRVQNSDGTYDATFAATGLSEFGPNSPGVTLIGRGDENGVMVDLRTTIQLGPTSLTILRESCRPGEEWLFRNRYTFTR